MSEFMTDGWTSSLIQAFGVLLGRPLSEYDADATYGTFYGGNWLSETGLNRDPAWLDPAVLAGRQRITFGDAGLPDDEIYSEMWFDPGGSIFSVAGPSDGFARDLAAAELPGGRGLIRGADLAPLLARHAAEVATPEWAGAWSLSQARIASDGTLLDALRVATGIGDDAVSLIPDARATRYDTFGVDVDAIADAALRARLRGFCRTNGDMLELIDESHDDTPIDGCPRVIGWQGAVDQWEILVLRLSDEAAGT